MKEIIKYESQDGCIFENKFTCLEWEALQYFEYIFDNSDNNISIEKAIEADGVNFMRNLRRVLQGLKVRINNASE